MVGKYRTYPKYSHSGVEWLGEVPAHWNLGRLKDILKDRITDGPHTTPTFVDSGIPFLSVDGIQDGELKFENCRYVSDADHKEFCAKAFPRRDDLLMGKAASTGKIARVKVDFEFSIWSPLALIRIDKANSDPRFIEQQMKSPIAQAQIDNLCTANTQKNISMDDIPKITMLIPPLAEQTQIANFLDHETAKIDALVEKQQQLIKLLQEKRQAVISHAVTKGLNPNAPMRDSGVEWLGELPEHWAVCRFKFLVREGTAGPYGSSLTKAMYTLSGVRVYGQQQVIPNDFSVGDYYIPEEKFKEMQRYEVSPGDVLISVMGTVGKVAVVPFGVEKGIINPRLVKYKLHEQKVLPQFVQASILSEVNQSQLQFAAQGSTMDGLNMQILGELPIAYPPLDEQRDLLLEVNRLAKRFDDLLVGVTTTISLLNERRTTLIAAAVTGKIDVRDWQASITANKEIAA